MASLIVGSLPLAYGTAAFVAYDSEYVEKYKKIEAQLAKTDQPQMGNCWDYGYRGMGIVECTLQLPVFSPDPQIVWSIGTGLTFVVGGFIVVVRSASIGKKSGNKAIAIGAPIK